MSKILHLKQGKTPLAVVIETEDGKRVVIDMDMVLAKSLYVGKELSKEEFKELRTESSELRIRNRLLNFISLRPHSYKEITDYMSFKMELTPEEITKWLDIVKIENPANDQAFAKWYWQSRLSQGKSGSNKIKAELYQKGVSRTVLSELETQLGARNSELNNNQNDYVEKEVAKIFKRYADLPRKKIHEKILRKLLARGFALSETSAIISRYEHTVTEQS